MPTSVNDPSWKKNCSGLTTNPSAPPTMTQATIAPPVWSPWVLISAMREPSGVVYHDSWFGSMLSVPLSLDCGGAIPLTASSRALLSSSGLAAALIPSIVPPVLKAAAHTGVRAESHALSLDRIVLRSAAGALEYLANCATSISASTFSVLVWKHCSMAIVVGWLPQLAGAGSVLAG